MIFDAVVIGGGVIGCAILNKLTRLNKTVALIEKGDDVALGASRANSGIVHAGFDCKPGTLKAKFNVEGNPLIYSLSRELGVGCVNCGAVVVGNDMDVVNSLLERGTQNGVTGLKVLNREQLLKLVPNLADEITCGLYAKTSGIVSPFMLSVALAEQAVLNGAKVFFNTNIKKITQTECGFRLQAKNFNVETKVIINAAGLGYNEVAKLIGSETYNLNFRRGEYYLLDNTANSLTNLTVFPLPSKISKGVLVTPTAHGEILVGPTSYDSDCSTITTQSGLAEIKQKAEHTLKNIPYKQTIRNFAGVRVICGDDFIVERSKLKNNVINIAGICSPGLTSAPAIANYVASNLLGLNYAEGKLKPRVPYTVVAKMDKEKLNKLIEQNSDYGKIVCKCEKVTLGEIKEALNSPLKPNSVDAIKRRVFAGMGRCQGGFCLSRVISAISKHCNIDENKVNKENLGSNFYIDNIK